MKLTLVEQETLVSFNEGEPITNVYTFNPKLKRKLKSLSAKHPDIFRLTASGEHGSVSYEMPKKHLSIRFYEPISEAESKRRSEWALKHKPLANVKRLSSNHKE
jgi:hypothetical protein